MIGISRVAGSAFSRHVEAQLQHVEIVLVVLDVEQPPHRIFIEPVKQEGAR